MCSLVTASGSGLMSFSSMSFFLNSELNWVKNIFVNQLPVLCLLRWLRRITFSTERLNFSSGLVLFGGWGLA